MTCEAELQEMQSAEQAAMMAGNALTDAGNRQREIAESAQSTLQELGLGAILAGLGNYEGAAMAILGAGIGFTYGLQPLFQAAQAVIQATQVNNQAQLRLRQAEQAYRNCTQQQGS